MKRETAWRELGLLALWLLATIGWRPLLLPDEGRYAGVAFEMLHGSALEPTLDGLPYFHKPPLLYWLGIAAMKLFGPHEFALRLGPALLAWGLGAALFLHLRRWHGERVARTGLVVLATTPLFYFGAQYVNHDIGVAACITAAVLAFVRAVEDPARTDRRWLAAGWALCGLGVLAKGLIGFVLPAFVVGPWLLAQGRWRQMLGLLHPLGLAAFAAVALPWPWLMEQRHPGFFDYFIVEQHFRRYATAHFNNQQPFWFFFVALPALMLPWSLWLWPAARVAGQAPARAGLYRWWVLAIVVFFSLPASKLVGYVLPAVAPMVALLALALEARGTRWRTLAAVTAAVCVAGVGALAWEARGSNRDLARALAERWRNGDTLAYADEPYFDVRLYAGVAAPAVVLADWGSADLAGRDDWHKELSDATRFAPAAGRQRLLTWDRVGELACTPGTVWVVAERHEVPRLGPLGALETAFEGRRALLLRRPAQPAGANCTPAAARSAAK